MSSPEAKMIQRLNWVIVATFAVLLVVLLGGLAAWRSVQPSDVMREMLRRADVLEERLDNLRDQVQELRKHLPPLPEDATNDN